MTQWYSAETAVLRLSFFSPDLGPNCWHIHVNQPFKVMINIRLVWDCAVRPSSFVSGSYLLISLR